MINVEATAQLSELAGAGQFVFLSTDLVFDGKRGFYAEEHAVNPLSVYGETKVAAERIVLSNPGHTVVRTSLNGGTSPTGDRGFNEQMRLAWQQGKTLRLFTDEYRAPIAAGVTARTLWETAALKLHGLYHVAGAQRLSRWEIGQALAARWPQLQPKMQPGSLTQYQGPPRPPDTSLDCAKAQALLSFRLPGLLEWLEAHPHEVF
jgi:dTDP-4-dehydrorhamnose reductase